MVQLDDLVYNLVMSVPRHRKRYLFIVISSVMTLYMANKKRIDDIISGRASQERRLMPRKKFGGQRRVGVNAVFLAQLRQLIPICVPGKE
jgi:hypothetical protein